MTIDTPNERPQGATLPGASDRDQYGPLFLTRLDCVLHILHLTVEAGTSDPALMGPL